MLVPISLTMLVMQPLNVISIQVIWSRFNKNPVEKEAFRNSISAFYNIRKLHGLRGYYRGFVPTAIIWFYLYRNQLLQHLRDDY